METLILIKECIIFVFEAFICQMAEVVLFHIGVAFPCDRVTQQESNMQQMCHQGKLPLDIRRVRKYNIFTVEDLHKRKT
jgi:hypothetical protein